MTETNKQANKIRSKEEIEKEDAKKRRIEINNEIKKKAIKGGKIAIDKNAK